MRTPRSVVGELVRPTLPCPRSPAIAPIARGFSTNVATFLGGGGGGSGEGGVGGVGLDLLPPPHIIEQTSLEGCQR